MSSKRPETFIEFVEGKPNLKYFFTGGKGGVGKTIAAAGIAYYFASQGKKTLLASLNPIHSLASVCTQEFGCGEVEKVSGIGKLYALECDITETVKRYRDQLAEKLRWFLKWADIPVKSEDFVDIAATNPSFEESAMFDNVIDIILEQRGAYDIIVFDCAAVANAVRLLGLSKIYDLWLSRMVKSREEALSLRVKLSFRKEKVMEEIKKDPMMADLINMRRRMEEVKPFFVNPETTAFFFVTLPLALPIAVVKRFIEMVKAFDIPVGGVFVNMVLTEEIMKKEKSEYMTNKYKEQEGYLATIRKDLWPSVRAFIPLYSTEVLGFDMIAKVSESIVNWKPS